jgi:hypothetical protein
MVIAVDNLAAIAARRSHREIAHLLMQGTTRAAGLTLAEIDVCV